MDPRRIVERFLKADVVPFGGKPKNPHMIKIHGVNYFLSNDGGPLGSDDDDEDQDRPGNLGGARIISGKRGFKYLWVMNTERKWVTMWRVTDGNNKLEESASSLQSKIVRLDRKNQFNRVDHKTYLIIKAVMNRIADDEMAAMKRTIENNKSDMEREIGRMVRDYFNDMVRHQIETAISRLGENVTPLGFKPHDSNPANRMRQMIVYVIGQILRRDFTEDKVNTYLRTEGVDLDSPEVGIQDVEWAINEVTEETYEQYLPARVPGEDEW